MTTETTTSKGSPIAMRVKATRTTANAAWQLATMMGAVLLAVIGCDHKSNQYAPPPPADVTIAHPVRRTVTRYLEATGTTEAFETVELRARVEGFLDTVNFKPGSAVKKGDVLFNIDPRTFQSEVKKQDGIKAQWVAKRDKAQADHARYKSLVPSGAATPQDVDKAQAELGEATAAIESAQAAIDRAKLDLEFCEVRSPINGRITKNFIDVGNLVGGGGQPTILAVIVNSRPIYVTFDASESDYLAVRKARMADSPGAEPGEVSPGVWRPIDLALGDETDFKIRGRFEHIDPALNAQSGTMRVRCRFENEDDRLVPGLFARLRIFQDQVEATLVPDIALLSDQSGRFALVVNDKNVVEIRNVQIGSLDGTMRVILSGLELTDRVIVNGLQRARPGSTVNAELKELVNEPSESPPIAPSSGGQAAPPLDDATSTPISRAGVSRFVRAAHV